MTDYKITELTANTAPILTDIIPMVDDPGGSALTQKITLSYIKSLIQKDGIIPVADTWTYASATTITVPSGAASIYNVGDKVSLIQTRSQAYTNDPAAGSNIELNMTDTSGFNVGNWVYVSSSAGAEAARVTVVHANTHITVDTLALNHTTTNPTVYIGKGTTGIKYFYIVGIADTTLTIHAGADYTLENATITSPYYSKSTMVGHPEWFKTTAPTMAVASYDDGAGGQPTVTQCFYRLSGRQCTVHLLSNGTKAGATNTVFSFSPATIWPTPSATSYTTSRRSCLGSILVYTTLPINGVMYRYDATTIVGTTETVIADNTTIADASFTITYEI